MEKKTSDQPKKLTAAQIAKKEENARQKIAFNLDNYSIATDICIAILQVDSSEEVKNRANEVLLDVLDKINSL